MATITLKDLARVTSIPDESNKNARSRPAYASFGDDGVTATANAHGHLLQITRYFGNEPSGFYCVDLPDTPPPNLIPQRLDTLNDSYQDHDVGMRLELEDSEEWVANSKTPMLKFIDDRWPLFVTETPSFDLSIQYFISEKTIYQEYSFELKKERQVESIPKLFINANLLIRNLNFVESSDENNRIDPDEEFFYKTHHNSRIIRKHGSLQTGIPGNSTVGLVIMPFIDGSYCTMKKKDRHTYQICPRNDVSLHPQGSRRVVVTIAYTLELMGSANDSLATPTNGFKATQYPSQAANDLSKAKSMMDTMNFEILLFAKERHLNFVLRRNLEHILSVCSIPIGDSSETSITPIALTCGDISNHRIMAGASFYAFEFLLLALKHLNNLEWACSCDPKVKFCKDYKCKMRYRIRRTCHGHLIWLYKITLQNNLSSHYWTSGKAIKSERNNDFLAEKSIMDIPFDIIKAADFFQIIADQDIRENISIEYQSIFERWIGSLNLKDKNKEYVFPHSIEGKIYEFFFAEQAIIWRALKSGEEFGIQPKVLINKIPISYSSLDIQNSVLQKFSCESSVSNKPMIAISRSVYGNTFKLKTQDTAIFHAVDHGIFTTSEDSDIGQHKMELWMNTLDHQMERDKSIHTSWSDLSQAALAVIISAKSRHTKPGSMKRRHESAKSALLWSSSPNGLLTGLLNEDQEPIFPRDFSECHSYWHNAFEIPYILWMHGVHSLHGGESLREHSLDGEAMLYTASTESTLTANSRQFYEGGDHIRYFAHEGRVAEHRDEWLYSKPQFSTFQADFRKEATNTFYEQNKSRDDLGTVIKDAIELLQQSSEASTESKVSKNPSKGYIVDVSEFAGSVEIDYFRPNYIYSATNLRLHIDPRVRSEFVAYNGDALDKDPLPTLAKKRLMHFYEMDHELAVTCYQASSEAEHLSRFFDRHATYDKYFYEDAQLLFNSWTTELHLSFYQILSGDSHVPSGISQLKQIPFPSFRNDNQSQSINRVSMSLRFDGDIFDSSWICHFIDINSQQTKRKTQVQPFTEINISNVTKKDLWQERKILELLILDKMLDEILQSSKHVLEQIKSSIWESSQRRAINQQETSVDYDTSMLLAEFEIFDKTPADAFLSIRSAWHRFQCITDIVEDDLRENIDTINLWMDREAKRHDKPQWPESSEHNHGWTISQLLAKNNRKFDELKRCYDSIKVFNASLTKRMEVASSKWEIQSSDDIRLFTYVTVVFLPISFATGIFSMSDAPSGNTLRHMIIVAAVALGATILALFNAKVLDSKLVRPVYHICQFVSKVWVYFIARYIYYPTLSQKKSEESQAKSSTKNADASTNSFTFANFITKARELFHEFDKPTLLARKHFEDAKSNEVVEKSQIPAKSRNKDILSDLENGERPSPAGQQGNEQS